jgi:anti-sigma B factor antagonist
MARIEHPLGLQVETISAGPREHVVALRGEIDLSTAPELRAALLALIDDGARRIVVDLTSTTFVDSTTLGVLLGAGKRLRVSGGELAIVCADRNIRRIFEITLLDRVFSIHATLAEASAAAG